MAKILKIPRVAYVLQFFCPACGMVHTCNESWEFNGDMELPTITPSLKVTWQEGEVEFVCHSVITKGVISFQDDSTHKFKGQSLQLSEIGL